MAMSTAPATLSRSLKSAMDLLYDARSTACICGGRAAASWTQILELNGHNVLEYKQSLLRLLKDLPIHTYTLLFVSGFHNSRRFEQCLDVAIDTFPLVPLSAQGVRKSRNYC